MTSLRIARPWMIWLMAALTVGVVALFLWTVAWPMWREHHALQEFAAAFDKESASGYLRNRKNDAPPPGEFVFTMREFFGNPMEEFDQAVGKIKTIRQGGFAVPWLMERLRSADSVDCQLAAHALGHIGCEAREAIPTLVKLLTDTDSGVHIKAGRALSEIGAAAVPALIEATEQLNPALREEAFRALEQMRLAAAPAIPALKVAVKSQERRRQALSVFASIGPPAAAAMPEILEALNDSDLSVRVKSAECVWKVNKDTARAIETIVEILRVDNWSAHLFACSLLEEMGLEAAPAVPALTDLLKHVPCGYDLDIRDEILLAIVRAIGSIGIPADGTVPTLVQLLADQNETVSSGALEALEKLAVNSDEALYVLIAAVPCTVPRIQLEAIMALGKLGPRARRGVPALKAVLDNPDKDIVECARYAISEIDPSVSLATAQP